MRFPASASSSRVAPDLVRCLAGFPFECVREGADFLVNQEPGNSGNRKTLFTEIALSEIVPITLSRKPFYARQWSYETGRRASGLIRKVLSHHHKTPKSKPLSALDRRCSNVAASVCTQYGRAWRS